MGSKKHKKHHKSEKKDKTPDVPERPEKRLKLVLKVGGSSASEHGDSPHFQPPAAEATTYPTLTHLSSDPNVYDYEKLPEKHKKSKKKKKKKSSEKDKHEKKHKHHHHHHHHGHDRKDRPKRDHIDSGQDDFDTIDDNGCLKRALYGEDLPERLYREPRACTLKNRQGKSPLQHLLDYLLKALEKKDPQQFFAWPVTDHIAPGYSSIIGHPMDFSTMRQKIESGEYSCLSDFKDDLKLLCENCMTYNRADTMYFKAAKKMLHVGSKMMSKEKLLPLRHALLYMSELQQDELGFDMNDETPLTETEAVEIDENTPVKDIKKKSKPSKPSSKFEAYQDDLSPEEILAQAQKAAADAAARLTLKRPNSKFGFLRQRKDGTTTLSILAPDDGQTQERQLTLEHLTGKLAQGTGALAGFREDNRNVAKPITYRNYGPYGSYGPTHDSTFANLTKEESDLLFSTYGDETGMQYAESIMNFARDSDFMTTMVDNLLDVLTSGNHSKAMKIIEEKRKLKEAEQIKAECVFEKDKQISGREAQKFVETKRNVDSVSIDYDSLRSLADLGIDVSFLDDIEKDIGPDSKVDLNIQKKLDETTELLNSLQEVQHNRLSMKPPPHLAHVMEPSSEELELADKVSTSIKDIAKQATPGDLTSLAGLRKAIGISLEPFFSNIDQQTDSPNCKTPSQSKDNDRNDELPPPTDPSSPEQLTQEEPGADLESELQEFLETGPALRVSDSPNQMDQTLEETLLV